MSHLVSSFVAFLLDFGTSCATLYYGRSWPLYPTSRGFHIEVLTLTTPQVCDLCGGVYNAIVVEPVLPPIESGQPAHAIAWLAAVIDRPVCSCLLTPDGALALAHRLKPFHDSYGWV